MVQSLVAYGVIIGGVLLIWFLLSYVGKAKRRRELTQQMQELVAESSQHGFNTMMLMEADMLWQEMKQTNHPEAKNFKTLINQELEK